MTIKSSGPLTISEIIAEFGSAHSPINFSDYYRGGTLVPNAGANSNISLNGELKISMFYGASNLINIDYLLIGGGASGGGGVANSVGGGGGAGGAGGMLFGTVAISPAIQSADIVIGKGGPAVGGYSIGNDGTKSSITFESTYLEATGGIHGNAAAGKWNYGSNAAGGAGGLPNNGNINAGRGGNGRDDTGGNGGYAGTIWPINNTRYAGGGGGGGAWGGPGGAGGGGNGGGGAGLPNTGSGGGGGNQDSMTSGKGADGVAIFSYVSATQIFKGGVITTTGSGATKRWFHTFTSSGFFGLIAGTTYTEPGWHTYTLPDNIDTFDIEFIGAGAGGAYASNVGNPTGGGGGAGGWGKLTIAKVAGVNTVEVYVGAGGLGGNKQYRYTYKVIGTDAGEFATGNPMPMQFYVYKANGVYTTDYGGLTYTSPWSTDLRVYSSTSPQTIGAGNYLGAYPIKQDVGIGIPNGVWEWQWGSIPYGVYDETVINDGTGGNGEATLVRYNGVTYTAGGGTGGGKPYANNDLRQSGGLGGTAGPNGGSGNSGNVSTSTLGGDGGNSHYTDIMTLTTKGTGGTNANTTNVVSYAGTNGNNGGGGGGGGGNIPLSMYGAGGKGGNGWAKLTY